jgi:bla regulator protein BlaR1
MTSSIWLRDVGAFALQVTLVVGAGAALARAFRILEPRATLPYWQALLAVCLLLPVCQPWIKTHTIAPALDARMAAVAIPDGPGVVPVPVARHLTSVPMEKLVLLVLGAGIAARSIWLMAGAFALRRLRREASPLVPLPPPIRKAQERVGASADLCVSDRFAGPITFGVIHPVVVFPPGVHTMPPHVQEAIAYHELLHVRRRDWVYEVLEEAVRTVFWFHPAIWWLIGRIRLSREQVVDQAAIRLTESRDRYVEALLAVALAKSPLRLALAPPFLRRSLLKKRVAQILQETTMTTRRLIASLTASAAALALAATVAVRSFPLEAQGQRPATAPAQETPGKAPVQIVKGGEHLLHAGLPEYPHRAIEQRVEGEVLLDLAIDDRGEVSDARVLSGPDELRKAALESVLQWHYSPDAVRSMSTQAALRFHLPAEGSRAEFGGRIYVVREDGKEEEELAAAQRAERRIMEIEQALESPRTTAAEKEELQHKYADAKNMMVEAETIEMIGKIQAEQDAADRRTLVFKVGEIIEGRTFEGSPRLAQVKTERVSPAVAYELLARAGVKIGDPITKNTARRIREIASGMDEHFEVSFDSDGKGRIVLVLLTR